MASPSIYNDNNTYNGSPFIFRPALVGTNAADTIDGLAGNDLIYGLGGNDTLIGGTGIDTMRGGTGSDTYSVDHVSDVVEEVFDPGIDTVEASVSYTLGNYVENLTLIGTAYRATGNSLNNTLIGNNAANFLDGGTGADKMQGKGGNDIYVVDNTGDQVVELFGQGTDTVQSSLYEYTLGNYVENLVLTNSAYKGVGNSLNNNITGSFYNNYIDGGAGADTMKGGNGGDTYVVDNFGDIVEELDVYAGTDTVISSVNHLLAANVENLKLTGNATIAIGNAINNEIIGNDLGNHINGSFGADTMKGGLGDDLYFVETVGDKVEEKLGQGKDTVDSSLSSYTLTDNVENLRLSGSAYAGFGNSLNNELTGTNLSNYLSGGAGADVMKGKGGNDYYEVDNVGDVVEELAGQGTDKVYSSIHTYTLGANVENLDLQGTAYQGVGNTLGNIIRGTNSANYLAGKAGNDTLHGGGGNDGMYGGTGNDSLFGEAENDRLRGFDSGIGERDTLNGGAGFDRYILGNTITSFYSDSGYATITHWEADKDRIEVFGSYTGYELVKEVVAGVGSDDVRAGIDTKVMLGSDIIAIIQDTTSVFKDTHLITANF